MPRLMSAISSAGETLPASIWTFVTPAPGAPLPPRLACPVGSRPSWRAEALSISQPVSTPLLINARRATGSPSPSKGRERRPRARNGSSMTVIALSNNASPRDSSRKLDRRAIAGPTIPPIRWPSRPDPMRGSKRMGSTPLSSLAGLRRATARSPARVPMATEPSRSSRWRAL